MSQSAKRNAGGLHLTPELKGAAISKEVVATALRLAQLEAECSEATKEPTFDDWFEEASVCTSCGQKTLVFFDFGCGTRSPYRVVNWVCGACLAEVGM